MEVVHHRQEASHEASWETCVPGGGPGSPGTPQEIEDDGSPVKSRMSAVSLAQCRLQRMDHLLVDRDILRGIALRECLGDE